MRAGVVSPRTIIDIKKIPEMTAIEETAQGGFRIGAAVAGAVLREHPRSGRCGRGVVEATNLIGSTQIQGRASAGGNLCNASPAGDWCAGAWSRPAQSSPSRGRRDGGRLPVEAVPKSPGRRNLEAGEIVVGFTLPARPKGASDAYLRMIPRTEMDIAVVGCGVSLTLDKSICTAARVGLGARRTDRAAGRRRRQGPDRIEARRSRPR